MMAADFQHVHATPINSIRAMCWRCMGYQPSEIRLCTDKKCPCFPYRDGTRPRGSTLISLEEAIKTSKHETAGIDTPENENVAAICRRKTAGMEG